MRLATPDMPPIPKSLYKLHRWADVYLPPTVIREGRIQVDSRGVPTGLPRALDRKDCLIYCDPIETTKTIIRNRRIQDTQYFGMQILVEQRIETWHSTAWGSSNRCSSGVYAYYPAPVNTPPTERDPIFVGDFVAYRNKNRD